MLEKSTAKPLTLELMKNFFRRRENSRNSQRNDRIGSLGLIQHSRPSYLPAKNPDEETKHQKEHDEILESVRRRETQAEKERNKKREERYKEEERLLVDSRLWTSDILPNFEQLRLSREVQDLWWRGLPPSIRGRVWRLGISNKLNIQGDIYRNCLNELREKVNHESLVAIRLDVSRTFPVLCVFQEEGPLNEPLRSVLAAYCVYRPEVGYVQGMSFIGAVLTLNMEPHDAFVCFSNLLDNPCHKAAFTLDQRQMNVYYEVFAAALLKNLPRVHAHFISSGLSPDFYLLDWVYTIYAKAMPLDVACRVWDVFVKDGDEFLFRTALGVLNLYQEELLGMDFVRCAQFLTKLPENLQASQLFESIGVMTVCPGGGNFQKIIDDVSRGNS
ncbi:TBC1 domain family member 14-like [Fopius arisanus]|uniref:TBC1 domain family member 14-like n=1 Tax=Fopius arisanus TaxID=64838 RepID=A0A9R1THK5_9HYME|nr:PREDICTED: TBC1 domain family member 14-like [Fopius arisanus]